jgi:hypothetical protein
MAEDRVGSGVASGCCGCFCVHETPPKVRLYVLRRSLPP